MSKKARTPRTHTRNHTKRHGKHHKQSRSYAKTYFPYLPLFISIIASIFLSFWQPNKQNTLAYATGMSRGGLLASTNQHRATSGRAALTLNSSLNSSAQAKANDMVNKNYWSHTTPSGQEPWVFIDNAGYAYAKAGENLAYGFTTAADAVVGWMNSPTHKANMLDGSFSEVGFGFANSANFNGDGQQTVIVAHYGQPQAVASKPAPAPTAAAPTAPSSLGESSAPAPTTEPRPKKPSAAEAQKKPEQPTDKKEESAIPLTTASPMPFAASETQVISKGQSLTQGHAPWILGATVLLTGLALIILLLHHSLKARHLLHDIRHGTERFVLHHPLLESTLLGLALLAAVLSRATGVIL